MVFTKTALAGAYIIELEKQEDQRGFFARTYCEREFGEHGLATGWVQCNISFNKENGTLRGLHYQIAPHEEAKLVRCTRGAIYDAIVDLRPDSPTFKHYFAVTLSEENGKALYVPEGFAHGFLTLVDNTEVLYHMSAFYAPDHGRGVRWNDPAFGIPWPHEVLVISDRDRNYPDFES